jgi:TatA/E family protein of Tat protein translocase
MFDLLQPTHLFFVLLVALVVLGPKRLIEMSRDLGRTIQKHKEDLKEGLLSISNEEEPEKQHSEKKG